MTDFVNKVITLVLIFVMLVLDKVTDKAHVSEHDLDTLYLAVNSHGQAYDVKVQRYQVLEEPKPTTATGENTTKLIYVSMDDIESLARGELVFNNNDEEVKDNPTLLGTTKTYIDLNPRDVIKVHVEEVSISSGKRLFWNLLRVDKGIFEFSLAGTVR